MFDFITKKAIILPMVVSCMLFNFNAKAIEQKVEFEYKTDFTQKDIIESVYKRPYNAFDNNIEYKFIKSSLITMGGASIIGAGILYLLPESFTNWDRGDASNIFKKWKNNVSEGPV